MKHKRNDPMCDPWDSQGNGKNAISISIAFCLDFLIRNENITSEKCSSTFAKSATGCVCSTSLLLSVGTI